MFGLYWGYIEIIMENEMENKMETTMLGLGYRIPGLGWLGAYGL